MEELKHLLEVYKATDIKQDGSKITATLLVEQIESDDEEEDTFSPFLSLCSGIAGTDIKMRIVDWVFDPQSSYKVELEV